MRVIKQILQFLLNLLCSSNTFVRRTVQTIKRDTTRYFFVFRCVRKVAKSCYQLRHMRPSVRMEQLGSHWTDFMKVDIRVFFENLLRKCKFH